MVSSEPSLLFELDRAAVLRHWTWRNQISGQIVNTDIDGLLSAALMHHLKAWPIVGFYDTHHLWLSDAGTEMVRTRVDQIAWVDLDMCAAGFRSIGQHVVSATPADAAEVAAYALSINPSLIAGHCQQRAYTTKYPFGTFQWLWWLARLPPPALEDEISTGLLWMPDGGFESIRGHWQRNCREWATRRMRGSPLSAIVEANRDAWVLDSVITAERWLADTADVPDGWSNHQYRMTSATGSSQLVIRDPSHGDVAAELTRLLQAIATHFGWLAAAVPREMSRWDGAYITDRASPLDWPASANRRDVISAAVTSTSRWCYTLASDGPRSLRELLGTPADRIVSP